MGWKGGGEALCFLESCFARVMNLQDSIKGRAYLSGRKLNSPHDCVHSRSIAWTGITPVKERPSCSSRMAKRHLFEQQERHTETGWCQLRTVEAYSIWGSCRSLHGQRSQTWDELIAPEAMEGWVFAERSLLLAVSEYANTVKLSNVAKLGCCNEWRGHQLWSPYHKKGRDSCLRRTIYLSSIIDMGGLQVHKSPSCFYFYQNPEVHQSEPTALIAVACVLAYFVCQDEQPVRLG